MLDIEIKTVDRQRYDTVGDYFEQDGKTIVNISNCGDWRYEFLMALHELVELHLCKLRGITNESIDAFDMSYTGDGEPGDETNAPYYKEHRFATLVEQLMSAEMGVNWDDYERSIEWALSTQKVTVKPFPLPEISQPHDPDIPYYHIDPKDEADIRGRPDFLPLEKYPPQYIPSEGEIGMVVGLTNGIPFFRVVL